LDDSYKGNVNLATIVYLHRISDNRMTGTVLKNLEMFATLCGQKAMPNVIIATTMWGEVKRENGERREQELKREFWKGMVDDGCRTERFKDSYDSAWHVIGNLAKKERARVLLSHEIVDSDLRLNETQAGIALNKELEKLIKDRKDAARRLRDQVQNQNNELVVQELNKRQAEIEEKINQTADQLRELKIPFTRRVRLFFKGRG
jgi:chromosome condensin MukBEF ATPase and DNA-binding subunit MukB